MSSSKLKNSCKMMNEKLLKSHLKDPASSFYPIDSFPSFFKIMIGDFTEALFIPPKFAENLDRIINNDIYLEDSAGKHWMVKFRKGNDDSLAFKQGWSQFVLDHSISTGELVIFRHVSNSTFSVHIFGTNGCERFTFTRKHSSETNVEKKAKNIQTKSLEEEIECNTKRKRSEDERIDDIACSGKAHKNLMNENHKLSKVKKLPYVAISDSDDSDKDSFSYNDMLEENCLRTSPKKLEKLTTKSEKAKACKSVMQRKFAESKNICTNKGKISKHDKTVQTEHAVTQSAEQKCSMKKKEIWSDEHERENVDVIVNGSESLKVGFFDEDTIYVDQEGVARSLNVKEIPVQTVHDQENFANRSEAKSAPPGFLKTASNTKNDTKAESLQGIIRNRIKEMDAAKSIFCLKEAHTESPKQVVHDENNEKETVEEQNPCLPETQILQAAEMMYSPTPLQHIDFSITVSMISRSWLLLPEKLPAQLISKRRFLRNIISLVDPFDKHWPVLYYEGQCFTGFIGGWEEFVDANELQQGDTIVIEATDAAGYVCPALKVKFVKS